MKYGTTESWFSQFERTLVIAEIGINHNGDKETAQQLVDIAAEAGADAVKVQVRDLDALYTSAVLKDSLKAEQGTQYLLTQLRNTELTWDEIREIKKRSCERGLLFFGTPFDEPSAEFLDSENVPIFKIGSPDLTNVMLIHKVAEYGRPILLSTGMASEEEISEVIELLDSLGVDYAMLHCNSTYPASIEGLNLRFMDRLKEMTGRIVGYSGHERGFHPTLAAVSRGARIVERHITKDRSAEGPDHSASLEPSEFSNMVRAIREIEQALGDNQRVFNQGEQINRIALGKSIVARRFLVAGTTIELSDLAAKTPGRGVSPLRYREFIGETISRDIEEDDYIRFEDLSSTQPESRGNYRIPAQWGVVGRLNDFEEYLAWKPNLIEIHLTWRDLVQFNPAEVAARYGEYGQDLVVHAPEYFQDALIDFTTDDTSVLDYSLEMLRRTFELARALAPYFKGIEGDQGPRVVVHPGGHFESKIQTNRTDQYRRLARNLREVDDDGVELLVENMPPLPWYFGGQWFNTIFLDPAEIKQFAEMTGLGVCYDTSHALLSCNHIGISLENFTRQIAPLTRHLHVADGAGTTQEGLQLGSGELDFEHLFQIFQSIDSSFIVEIWQGHLNSGEGFDKALRQVETLMANKLGTKASCHHL